MARMTQNELVLRWEDIDEAPDVAARVRMMLSEAEDEELMRALERARKGRRDDYPVRVCWNVLLAGMVLGHRSTAAMFREVRRDPTLRRAAGISVAKGADGVPTDDAMCRFSKKLLRHRKSVRQIVVGMLEQIRVYLRDFGRQAAVDSTAIRTWARGRKERSKSADPGAAWGKKIRKWTDKEDKAHQTETKWYGYKAHLLVDSRHELPIAYTLTPANAADVKQLKPLFELLHEEHPDVKVKTLSADKAYDDGKSISWLYEQEHVRAVFAQRDTAQDGEDGEVLRPGSNVLLGNDGTVYCDYKKHTTIIRQPMVYWGWEPSRGTQKWRCPAAIAGHGTSSRPERIAFRRKTSRPNSRINSSTSHGPPNERQFSTRTRDASTSTHSGSTSPNNRRCRPSAPSAAACRTPRRPASSNSPRYATTR